MGLKNNRSRSLKLIGWQIYDLQHEMPEGFKGNEIYPLGDCLAWMASKEGSSMPRNTFHLVPIFEGDIPDFIKRGLNVLDPHRLRKFSAEDL